MGVKQSSSKFSETVKEGFTDRVLPTKGVDFADDNETTTHSVRLHRKRKEALQRLLKVKGMNLSTGIRWIVYEWLEKNMRG